MLTDAVRIRFDVSLHEGWDIRECEEVNCNASYLIIAASRERVMDVLGECLDLLGDELQPMFAQNPHTLRPTHYWKPIVDRPVMQSALYEFDDVVLHDGHASFMWDDVEDLVRVVLEPNKLIIVHALREKLGVYKSLMQKMGIPKTHRLQTIGNHKYELISSPELQDRFVQLTNNLAMFHEHESIDPDDFNAGSTA